MEELEQPEPGAPDEKVLALIKKADEAGNTCGLYMESAGLLMQQADDTSPQIMVNYNVGKLAFTNRVLDPPAEDDNKQIRELEVDMQLDRFNEIRQAGLGSIAELEEDE